MEQKELLKQVKEGLISPSAALNLMENTFTSLEDIIDEGDRRPLICGFPSMESKHYISANKPDFLVVGGRPGIGKTALLMQLAYNVSASGPVAVFSLEMTKEQLKKRLSKQGALNFRKHRLFIDDTPGLNIDQICIRTKNLAKNGLAMVAIDYLQIVPGGTGSGNKKDRIDEVCSKLKTLAKDLQCPVLVAAQLSRDIEKRAQDPDIRVVEPTMSDFGDSAGIEHWADGAFILYKDKKQHGSGEVGFYVVKYRHGPSYNIVLTYKGEITKFYDSEEF